jgi:hypothetical protein
MAAPFILPGPDREELALIRLDLDLEALIRAGQIQCDDTGEVIRFGLGREARSAE